MSIMRCMFSASLLVRTAVYLAMKQLWCVCVCVCVCRSAFGPVRVTETLTDSDSLSRADVS